MALRCRHRSVSGGHADDAGDPEDHQEHAERPSAVDGEPTGPGQLSNRHELTRWATERRIV
jgi:hypothetical protein